ncbi:hypothetical protein [Streptomyces rapamycinicus]|uniref:Uncharacterized protein n=2 Tax=Streptomyces rapamycinicus TaxID=1226757 RepID=A0A0A0NN01_STRRN|nr:hypothetical protein [Streptomyces rapamycinicus]AGP58339.1 hypothetical protein M271_34640 [Streptomyces rapamycinicus NRRL 5491]MBB4786033.1 hypothetical protein [Streptomyces rapamycinicus]RLV78504.1 hypothetical protein D3C57_109005 [Streptomyces rapamycinicus NRRL 5491]UTO66155.1 hypothetical protein LJB45_30100 [Streptomyces rapamycinicus]UTP34109.1 hypothetical protein LIV37_35235 [Streptomyces rapamycinicus NRRL 5491]
MSRASKQPELMSGAALAEALADAIETPRLKFLRHADAVPLVQMIQGREADLDRVPAPRGDSNDDHLLAAAGMVAATRMWRETRVVYDFDPSLSESLVDMELDSEFPGEVLRRLPHPNPLFLFRKPILSQDQFGRPTAMRGFVLMLRPSLAEVVSTVDIDKHDGVPYAVIAVVDVLDEHGSVLERQTVELFAPTKAENTTARKMMDEAPVIHVLGGEMGPQDSALREYMARLTLIVVSHLLYVCCDKPDLEKVPAPPRRAERRGIRQGRAAQVHRVGWRLGPAIRQFHEKVDRLRRTAIRRDWKVIPHVRRGHPHTFLFGPRKSLKKVKWIPPLLVNAAAFGRDGEGIIVPVH